MADHATNSPTSSGPLLQLLASGLQLWVRQQCEAVESLEINLHGSSVGLLRGRLEGVSLVARGVVFSSLEIERVELRSGAIRVQMGNLLRGQPLRLDQPFEITGMAAFSGPGLSRSLCTTHWRGLGDQLADGLLGLVPLQELRIERDCLVLRAQQMSCDTLPAAKDGTLVLQNLAGDHSVTLPADPNIQITTAKLEGGLLQLEGSAQVTP